MSLDSPLIGTLPPAPATPAERAAAVAHVLRVAVDSDDRAELLAMLGLDAT